MSSGIEFDEGGLQNTRSTASNNNARQKPLLNFFVQKGIVQNETQAQIILLVVIVICAIATFFILSSSNNSKKVPDIKDIPEFMKPHTT